MPELPEVETVVNILNHGPSCGACIKQATVYQPKLLKNCNVSTFTKFLLGEKITNFKRIGKYINVILSNNKILLIHLRMEGKLFCENTTILNQPHQDMNESKYWSIIKRDGAIDEMSPLHPSASHLRISIELSNKYFLNFYDSRMFGTFHIYNTTTIKQAKELTILGPDAIGKDFNPIYLFNITRKSSKHIKTFILDQSNVAGIGNIYADEILYASHINPLKPTRELTKNDCTLLVNNCQKILQRAIKAGGTTFATFASAAQKIGSFQNQLQVYGKENKMCEKCHHKILKIKINGRGSCYCPHCQKN